MIAWLTRLIQSWRIRNAAIDLNAKCPACGHRQTKIRTVFVTKKEKPNRTVMVERTCQVCSAQCYEPTIVKPEDWVAPELLADFTVPQNS